MKQTLVFTSRLLSLLAALASATVGVLALLIVVYVLGDFVHALVFDGSLDVSAIAWEQALTYLLVIAAATRLGDVANVLSGKLLGAGSSSSE